MLRKNNKNKVMKYLNFIEKNNQNIWQLINDFFRYSCFCIYQKNNVQKTLYYNQIIKLNIYGERFDENI